MDVELREALNHGFGPEPQHRPLADRLEAGRRAVRRRRLAGSAVAVAAAAVVGIGASLLAGGAQDSPDGVATDPTAASTPSNQETPATNQPWGDGELARYSTNGLVEIRPGVTVLHQIDEPYGDPSDFNHSVALAVEYHGAESWLLLTWETDPNGDSSSSSGAMAHPEGSFADWVAQNAAANEDNSAGYVEFADDGSLVASHGVEILDQRHPVHLKDFTFGDEPSAAALLQGPDGKKWFVLVRYTGDTEVIAVPTKIVGNDELEAFLDYAAQKYQSGEGLR
jgi:hypothetical protein